MPETAQEAARRVIAPILDKIRLVPLASPCAPEHIPPHTSVKVDGEWVRFDGYQESTGLMFLSSGSAGFTHRPGDDELIQWAGRF